MEAGRDLYIGYGPMLRSLFPGFTDVNREINLNINAVYKFFMQQQFRLRRAKEMGVTEFIKRKTVMCPAQTNLNLLVYQKYQ